MRKLKSPEEFIGIIAQFEKLIPYRFEPIADRLSPVDRSAVQNDPRSCRTSFMTDDEVELRRVDQDLSLGGLHGQDVGHMLVRDGITVGLELDVSFKIADPERHFGAVIGMERQGRKGWQLLFEKEFQGRSAGCIMLVAIAFLAQPPAGTGPEIIEILKLSAAQKISLHVLKGTLDFSFRFRPTTPADDRTAAIMGDEGGKGRIDHRPARLPAQDDCFFTVVETLGGRAGKMREGLLVTSDQGEKIPPWGEVDKLPPGEAQDVRETLDPRFTGFQELDGVRAPVHLSLKARLCLETNNGRFLGGGSETPKPIPQDTDAAVIPCVAKFFKEPQSSDPGVFLQKPLERLLVRIELAGPFRLPNLLICKENIMTLIPQRLVLSQDTPHQVPADGQMPGKSPDGPTFLGFHKDQLLFEICPVFNHDGHRLLFLLVQDHDSKPPHGALFAPGQD